MSFDTYRVKCPEKVNHQQIVEAKVPGSKSITNRALLLAAMANGTSVLKGCLTSDDAMHFLSCLKTLGFPVAEESDGAFGSNITITGFGGEIPNKCAEIYVGSAGTAARFLAAMLAFSNGEYIVQSSDQMKKRPMQPLIDVLRDAGAIVECLENEGHFPMRIVGMKGRAVFPTRLTVNVDKSSQFLSALMIAAGTFPNFVEIAVEGSHGFSYVDMTAKMMKQFGNSCIKNTENGQILYHISNENCYQPLTYSIEPDMSAAAYFYAMAAVLGVTVKVCGVCDDMLQGDIAFLSVLEKIGCKVKILDGYAAIAGPTSQMLKGGFSIDMSAFSDQALTLAAIAPFADAPITITGIGHIRLQECDRIHAIICNLRAMGIRAEETEDSVTIYPGALHGAQIKTFDDHRVAMSFALTGLRVRSVVIENPSCCKKTFAQYFNELERILNNISSL